MIDWWGAKKKDYSLRPITFVVTTRLLLLVRCGACCLCRRLQLMNTAARPL